MRASTLRHRIIIQEPTAGTADDFNESTDSWDTYATVWAAIVSTQSTETKRNEQIVGEATHVIRMRHFAGVTSKMRVKFGTRYFNILSVVNPNEKNRTTELICKESV